LDERRIGMFRKRATWVGVLLTVAAATVALVLTVGAQAGRENGERTLVLQSVGPLALEQVSPDCFGTVADLQSTKGRRIGRGTSCIDAFVDGEVGGFVATGRFIFELPGGDLAADFRSHLTAPGTIDPITTGPLALPPPFASSGDQFGALVTDARITGGTKRFAKTTGTITNAGFIVDSSDQELKWGNITFVLDLQD
jgi:hypothetical protein